MIDWPSSPTALAIGLAALAVGGFVRGLTGFGGALVCVPVLSALHGPAVAVPAVVLLDGVLALPMLRRAARLAAWRDVTAASAGALLMLPAGIALLASLPAALLTRAAGLAVLATAFLMAFGWPRAGRARTGSSFAAGALSGVMQGAVGLSGPPVVLYWLSRHDTPHHVARASIVIVLGVVAVAGWAGYLAGGFIDARVLGLIVTGIPAYGGGLLLGAIVFPRVTERRFRRLSLAVVALSGVAALLHG